MAGSAIQTSTYQGLASNIYNADKTTPIYNGGWDFKNASAVTTLAVSSTGSVNLGPATFTGNSAYHSATGNGLIFGTSQATYSDDFITVGNKFNNVLMKKSDSTIRLYAGVYYDGSTKNSTANLAGSVLALNPTSADSSVAFEFRKLWDGDFTFPADTTLSVLSLAQCTSAGAWSNISGGSWGTLSDSRLKKNVENLNSGLAAILALRPVKYAWRDENVSKFRPTEHFIAQEVELVNPKWVTEGGTEKIVENGVEVEIENCKKVSLDASFNAYLVKAIQEIAAKLDEANAKIAALEAK